MRAAMKRGLDQPPLARVLLALAHEQAVAEKNARALQRPALAKRMLLRDQHFVHQRGIAEEDEPLAKQREPRRIAARLLQLAEKLQRPAEPPVHAANERNSFGPGNRFIRAHRHPATLAASPEKRRPESPASPADSKSPKIAGSQGEIRHPIRGLPSACHR